MKLSELIKFEWLYRKDYALFNMERNWHVIHREKVYRITELKDQIFFGYETGKYDWDFVVKHIKRSLNHKEDHLYVSDYSDFELHEELDYVYIDNEKLKLD